MKLKLLKNHKFKSMLKIIWSWIICKSCQKLTLPVGRVHRACYSEGGWLERERAILLRWPPLQSKEFSTKRFNTRHTKKLLHLNFDWLHVSLRLIYGKTIWIEYCTFTLNKTQNFQFKIIPVFIYKENVFFRLGIFFL